MEELWMLIQQLHRDLLTESQYKDFTDGRINYKNMPMESDVFRLMVELDEWVIDSSWRKPEQV